MAALDFSALFWYNNINTFFKGKSIPVNKKLSEVLVQLHISEKSGRCVPRIVSEYGKDAFEFTDNSITVTIPFNRLDLGGASQVAPQDTPQVDGEDGDNMEKRIIDFCSQPRSTQEIITFLGLKDRKNVMKYLNRLLEQGRIARTIPNKPTSSNQKYVAIK